jgi:hypothetical protein
MDLDDFRELLARPFDPWIEDYQTDEGLKPLLRTASWAKLTEAVDVFRDAARMVERLNGEALLIYGDSKPVKLGETIKFGPNGRREPIKFAASFHARGAARARARATVITSGPPKPPEPSRMQKWFKEAETDDIRAELFAHLARADNWFDLYKSAELARRVVGDLKALKAALGSDWNEWQRICQTANCYRHAPDPAKFPLPTQPAELEEAREFILKVIPRML